MAEETRSFIVEPPVQREWLLRCKDSCGDLAVCSIGVSAGDIEVAGPHDEGFFRLETWEIASFRRALNEAIEVAEADLATR